MSLESLQMEQNETLDLAKELKELNILETEVTEAATAKSAIESLSDDKLVDYITKELQNDGSWISFPKMKSKPFYGFMVQASINAIGKKIGDKKYDENGNESSEGKTIVDWMNSNDGIDNKYGGKTSKVVKIVQNYLGIKADGKAGPQYFAYVCAALKNDPSYLENFKVEGSDNYGSKFDTTNRDTIDTLIGQQEVTERTIFDNYKVKCCNGITLSDSTKRINDRNIYNINFQGKLAGIDRLSVFRRKEPNGDKYSDHLGFRDSVENKENKDLAEKLLDVKFDKDTKEVTLKMKEDIDNNLITTLTAGQEISEKEIFDDKILKYSKGMIVDTNLTIIPGTNTLGYKVSFPDSYAKKLKTKDIYIYKSGNGEVLIGNPNKKSGVGDIIKKSIDGNTVTIKFKEGIKENIKEHWADDIEGDISEDVKDFVNRYWGHIVLPSSIDDKKAYISELDSMMKNIGQKATLTSMMNLDEKFRGNFKLNLANLKFFNKKMKEGAFDTSSNNNVFEVYDGRSSRETGLITKRDGNDYVTYQDGKLIKIDGCYPGETFEVDGTHLVDDRRFDSIAGFFAWLRGEKVATSRQNVKESANADLMEWKSKFDDSIVSNPSILGIIGSKGSNQYKTFISLLTLPNTFRGSYKLTEQDIKDFKKGMEKDIFDYKTGSATVFHKKSNKFEVDGTGYLKDEQFTNVKIFFSRLHGKV